MMAKFENYKKLKNRYLNLKFKKVVHFPQKGDFPPNNDFFFYLKDTTALSSIILK